MRWGGAVLLTPNPEVNRGVLWAKANMMRTLAKAQTGWCFVNDPTRSNNSVGRDTSWFAYGGDYLNPEFVREALLAYVHNQESSGKVVEYYDIRNGKTADYDLNVNDNTPLLVLALWHHYNTTGDGDFSPRRFTRRPSKPPATCCLSATSRGWSGVRRREPRIGALSAGAMSSRITACPGPARKSTPSATPRCLTVSHMARVLDKHDESREFMSKRQTRLRLLSTRI